MRLVFLQTLLYAFFTPQMFGCHFNGALFVIDDEKLFIIFKKWNKHFCFDTLAQKKSYYTHRKLFFSEV